MRLEGLFYWGKFGIGPVDSVHVSDTGIPVYHPVSVDE